VIGGDKRSMTFLGDCALVEEELYCGQITDDQELTARAEELGAILQIADGREKVWQQGDILVGEVTEITPQTQRRRRIYLAPGAYLLVEVEGSKATAKAEGRAGCIVLGNKYTQKLVNDAIVKTRGRIDEDTIRSIFFQAASKTPSVSRDFTIFRSDSRSPDPEKSVMNAFLKDCEKSGWRLCGQQ
jgi:hypothetical protein